MSNSSNQDIEMQNYFKGVITAYIVFVGLWIVVGLIAFVWSLVCFAKSGSIWEKILGLVLSIIVGPFYFIYLALNKGYCR